MDIYMIFIFLFGLIIGSFLNVCIYRIPQNTSISFPPSHCTNCNNRLKAYDLIPVFSYILLKGKCRYCGQKISSRYPTVELLNAIFYVLIYQKFGLSIEFIKFCFFSSLMIVIALIDYDTMDVYFKISLTGFIVGGILLLYRIFNGSLISTYIYGMLFSGAFILLIILITKGGMGLGDVEICAISGLYLGFKLSIVMLLMAFILGGIIGCILIMTKKKSRKEYIPFGPFISLASILTVCIGDIIINWYITFLY